jgi:FkbM family methyltransferase
LVCGLWQIPTWRHIKGGYNRRRRALRRAILEPLLVGKPVLRDTVMHALADRGHLVYCQNGDVSFFVDPSDRVVGAWLMWHGGYQRREIDKAITVLAENGRLSADAVFVDIGANIGTHTVYALRSGQFTRAVAFEPEPKNARLLAMNMEANGVANVVTVVPKAAGEATGTATLYLHPRNKGAHALGRSPSVDGQEQFEVPVVRVEDVLAECGVEERVGLLWVDVEGHELHVMRGLKRLLARGVPISFEYTPQQHSDEAKREITALLGAHYTQMRSLNDPSRRLPISALLTTQNMDDFLAF